MFTHHIVLIKEIKLFFMNSIVNKLDNSDKKEKKE